MPSTVTKSVLVTAFLLSTLSPRCQPVTSSFIDWDENHKLKYSDYKIIMRADSMTDEAGNWIGYAATGVRISQDFWIRDEYLEYEIYSFVDVNRSYIKPDTFLGESESYVLEHEQIHFDISELYARKMRKFLTVNGGSCNEEYVAHALDSIYTEQWKRQSSFDTQSMDEFLQSEWKKDIKKELADLNNYKTRKGRVKRKK